jgi:hypothetical protein
MPRLKELKDAQRITLHVPSELVEQVRALGRAEHRTLSQEIRLALVKHVKAAQAPA